MSLTSAKKKFHHVNCIAGLMFEIWFLLLNIVLTVTDFHQRTSHILLLERIPMKTLRVVLVLLSILKINAISQKSKK